MPQVPVFFFIITALSLVAALPAAAQDMTGVLSGLSEALGAPSGDSGPLSGRILQLVGIMTVLSLAPGLLVVMTSFTRFVIVFSMLRTALGLQQSPPNMVLTSLAFFMTLFVMQPVFEDAWNDGLEPLLANEITEENALPRITDPFHRFMLANTRDKDIELFLSMTGRTLAAPGTENTPLNNAANAATDAQNPERTAAIADENTPWAVLVPAFMISELKRAFTIGFLIFLPFIAIDLIVASVLMAAGMMMLPPVMIALPFKIIFFVLIDGWYMLAGSLMQSYAGY